jgi:hypothetical protein
MFRVTDSATRSLYLIIDHRDNRVIGDAALAWTIIVQHVARPMPAVLHATPPKTESASRQAASVLGLSTASNRGPKAASAVPD